MLESGRLKTRAKLVLEVSKVAAGSSSGNQGAMRCESADKKGEVGCGHDKSIAIEEMKSSTAWPVTRPAQWLSSTRWLSLLLKRHEHSVRLYIVRARRELTSKDPQWASQRDPELALAPPGATPTPCFCSETGPWAV